MIGPVRDFLKLLWLGILLMISVRAFQHVAGKWFPEEFAADAQLLKQYTKAARTLQRKFRQSVLMAGAVGLLAVATAFIWKGRLAFDDQGKLTIAALMLVLIAAIGRGGWEIKTVKSKTVIERIDRGMYVIEQLGAAGLLMLAVAI